MFNNEMFTSPDKCISECLKQIEFSNNLITYLQQYIVQLETMKMPWRIPAKLFSGM